MPSEPPLIDFRDNSTAHDDLHICIEGYSRIADSYYLALDRGLLGEDESVRKVRLVLIRLLEHWIEALTLATPVRPAYLPYEFADEYTGCFQCRPDGEVIQIVPGFSRREGWSFYPSQPGDYVFAVSDFQTDTPTPIILTRANFMKRIQESIEATRFQLLEPTGQLQ